MNEAAGPVQALVTFVIPCYNSADYLHRAVEPLLRAPDDIEVVLVNDGSTDATPQLIEAYVRDHPERVRAVHRENGGHGAAMDSGIGVARGTYVKVLDSDDWTDPSALADYLRGLRAWIEAGTEPDVVITNYVYENEGLGSSRSVRYGSFIPAGRICTWEDLARPRTGRYLLMHALTYRLEVLRRSGVSFPPHTFYVDNLMAAIPLREVRTLAYLDLDLYRYFIGREDQSVQEKVMLTRIDQQLRVNRLLVQALRSREIDDRRHRRYLLHYATIVCSVSLTLTALAGTEESRRDRRDLLQFVRRTDPKVYRAFRRSPTGILLSVPGRGGEMLVRSSYRIARRYIGFN
ncbi:glycosyltransferase family 2 protein [Brachybacterium hainanense]|uniref:Glycosyltransferase family 2 protein n=1 Tax=Brachybacterium hainanense TaxID=1541174 RepID=A0ABV6RJL4_9MICO